MEKSPRAKALSLSRSGAELETPDIAHLTPNSEEALVLAGELKERHYVSLARVIDSMCAYVDEKKPSRPPYGLIQRSKISTSQWGQIADNLHFTFEDARLNIEDGEEYEVAQKLTCIIGRLDSKRHIYLNTQLPGGINTASQTMLTLLRNTPELVAYHDPSLMHPDQLSAIAKRSINLPRSLAKTCINRMMAAQHALKKDARDNSGWRGLDAILDPEEFELEGANDSKHLRFKDFGGLEVEEGYTPHYTVPPVNTVTKVGDIACHQAKIIGCPVTLLNGRMRELWSWLIDIVDAQSLWSTYDPKTQ